jgi:hypothetical protein
MTSSHLVRAIIEVNLLVKRACEDWDSDILPELEKAQEALHSAQKKLKEKEAHINKP